MNLGIYRLHSMLDSSTVASIESEYGIEIPILSFYRAWNRCSIIDDLDWLHNVMESPREIMLTWEPWLIPAPPYAPEIQPVFTLGSIASGIHDPYISSFASTLAESGRPILLRPMHEMNGNWYPWCGTVNGNRPQEYVKAWRHMKRIFSDEGASNVKWIWSPYAASYPETADNGISEYFPGNDLIDFAALDAYNWGSSTNWSEWKTFSELIGSGYDEILSITSKPIIIAETACSEEGGNKAEWIESMFKSLRERFNKVEALIWFDVDKECDWRISSSLLSANAFRTNAPGFFGKVMTGKEQL